MPRAWIGLGSNQGDRARILRQALGQMGPNVRVEATSLLYETVPMHLEKQPMYLNAVCRIETRLSPLELLRGLRQVEQRMGRTPSVRYGPRCIDLDILLYGQERVQHPELCIPHARLQERPFVLQPLRDLDARLTLPGSGINVEEAWRQLGSEARAGVTRVVPIGDKTWSMEKESLVMGILNMTPDSFSDGRPDSYLDVDDAVGQVRSMLSDGADIIDVGGCSTRPGIDPENVSVQEEMDRVVPVLERIHAEMPALPLSIDTFRAPVAAAAVEAGACIVNDISGGSFDAEMLPLVARSNASLVLMHSRGTSSTMHHSEAQEYDDMLTAIRLDLQNKVERAISHGIPAWSLILDPGIGFSKTSLQSLHTLRCMESIRGDLGMPFLIGLSRKGFIGRALGTQDISDRDIGTTICNTIAAMKGATILRTHNVKQAHYVSKLVAAVQNAE